MNVSELRIIETEGLVKKEGNGKKKAELAELHKKARCEMFAPRGRSFYA
jgi:hypothetical protein